MLHAATLQSGPGTRIVVPQTAPTNTSIDISTITCGESVEFRQKLLFYRVITSFTLGPNYTLIIIDLLQSAKVFTTIIEF